MILVTGVTGHLGRATVQHLLASGAKGQFAVLARDPAKAEPYARQGIEVRIADFDAPDTLATAFAGIDTLLLVSTLSLDRSAQQAAVVDAAARAGVKHVVYTGLAIRDIATSATQAIMQSHFDTEAHIRDSGLAYTFLRNTMYADALPIIAGPDAPTRGLFLPGGAGRVPYALRAELGEAAANVLLQPGHEGRIYTLTAPVAWSYQDVAEALEVTYTNITSDALLKGLVAAGLPDVMVDLTLGTLQDIRSGQYDIASDDLTRLLDRPPLSLSDLVSRVFSPTA